MKHSREGRREPQGGCRSDWRSWSAWKVESNHKQLHLVISPGGKCIKVERMFFPYFWVFTLCVQPSGKTTKNTKIWDQRHFNGGSVSKHSFSKFQDFVIPISPKHQEHKAELSETKCKRRRIDFGTRGLLFTRYHSLMKQLLLNNITSWSLTF